MKLFYFHCTIVVASFFCLCNFRPLAAAVSSRLASTSSSPSVRRRNADSDNDRSSDANLPSSSLSLLLVRQRMPGGVEAEDERSVVLNGTVAPQRQRGGDGQRRRHRQGQAKQGQAKHHRKFMRRRRPDMSPYVNITLPQEPLTREQMKVVSRATFLSLVSGNSSQTTVIGPAEVFRRENSQCRAMAFEVPVEAAGCVSKTITLNMCFGPCKSVFIPKVFPVFRAPGEVFTRSFKSCSTCKPKIKSWTRVRLECPGQEEPFKLFKFRDIQECGCLTQNC